MTTTTRHHCGTTMRASVATDHDGNGTSTATHPWFCPRCLLVVMGDAATPHNPHPELSTTLHSLYGDLMHHGAIYPMDPTRGRARRRSTLQALVDTGLARWQSTGDGDRIIPAPRDLPTRLEELAARWQYSAALIRPGDGSDDYMLDGMDDVENDAIANQLEECAAAVRAIIATV